MTVWWSWNLKKIRYRWHDAHVSERLSELSFVYTCIHIYIYVYIHTPGYSYGIPRGFLWYLYGIPSTVINEINDHNSNNDGFWIFMVFILNHAWYRNVCLWFIKQQTCTDHFYGMSTGGLWYFYGIPPRPALSWRALARRNWKSGRIRHSSWQRSTRGGCVTVVESQWMDLILENMGN